MSLRRWPLSLALILLLGSGAAVGLAAGKEPEAGEDRATVKRIVVEEALRAGFPPSLALAVADAASGFKSRARGPAGASGVMLLRLETARQLEPDTSHDLFDARTNARLGIAYLAALLQAERGALAPALARMERGLPPEGPKGAAPAPDSPFVRRAARLHETYQLESGLWVALLKGDEVDWKRLRPDESALADLAEAARRLEAPEAPLARTIEQRRQAVRPYLDDFSS